MIKNIFSKQYLKYCVIGTIGGIIELALFYLLNDIMHINYLVANVITFIVTVTILYFLNKKFVYKAENMDNVGFIIFFVSRTAGFVIDSIVLTVSLKIFMFPSLISKFISSSSTTYKNYLHSYTEGIFYSYFFAFYLFDLTQNSSLLYLLFYLTNYIAGSIILST